MTEQVFISYAHADDQPFDEEIRGWVTNFVDKLQRAVATKSGGSRVRDSLTGSTRSRRPRPR